MVKVICSWDPASEKKSQHHRQWAEDLSRTLASMPGGVKAYQYLESHQQIGKVVLTVGA